MSFAMLAGTQEGSYTTNSQIQKHMLLSTKSLLEDAISQIKHPPHAKPFRIADMGCASGPNCLINMHYMLEKLTSNWKSYKVPEFQTFFCDMPSNDFNTLIQLWDSKYRENARSFFAAVPGSVYGRLFPCAALDIVFSSCCLNWLSQVPAIVSDPSNAAWNKGKMWIDGPEANEATANAYSKQSEKDLATFFKCRSEEMVPGAMMFLLLPSRPDNYFPHQQLPNKERCFRYLEQAWLELIQEGVIDQSEIDRFNLPMYYPSPKEIRAAAKNAPQLKLQRIELVEEAVGQEYWLQGVSVIDDLVRKQEGFFKSVFGNGIENQIGSQKCGAIFERFQKLVKNGVEKMASWDPKWATPWDTLAVLLFKEAN